MQSPLKIPNASDAGYTTPPSGRARNTPPFAGGARRRFRKRGTARREKKIFSHRFSFIGRPCSRPAHQVDHCQDHCDPQILLYNIITYICYRIYDIALMLPWIIILYLLKIVRFMVVHPDDWPLYSIHKLLLDYCYIKNKHRKEIASWK